MCALFVFVLVVFGVVFLFFVCFVVCVVFFWCVVLWFLVWGGGFFGVLLVFVFVLLLACLWFIKEFAVI